MHDVNYEQNILTIKMYLNYEKKKMILVRHQIKMAINGLNMQECKHQQKILKQISTIFCIYGKTTTIY